MKYDTTLMTSSRPQHGAESNAVDSLGQQTIMYHEE